MLVPPRVERAAAPRLRGREAPDGGRVPEISDARPRPPGLDELGDALAVVGPQPREMLSERRALAGFKLEESARALHERLKIRRRPVPDLVLAPVPEEQRQRRRSVQREIHDQRLRRRRTGRAIVLEDLVAGLEAQTRSEVLLPTVPGTHQQPVAFGPSQAELPARL